MRNIFLLISFLLSTVSFAADRVIPCDGANCKIIFETKNGSNVKVQAAQIDGTGVMSFPNAGGGMVPAGTIIAFAGASTPVGYLPCDGAAVSQTTYAALYAALGSTWDTQRNKSTGSNYSSPGGGLFRVPDLRGTFLRGTGTSAAPYASATLAGTQDDKTAVNNLNVSNSTHTHSMSHMHQFAATNASGATIAYNSVGVSYVPSASSTYFNAPASPFADDLLYASESKYGGHSFVGATPDRVTESARFYTTGPLATQTTTAPNTGGASAAGTSSDTETAPINVGVNYFIKY